MILTLKDVDGEEGSSEEDDSEEESIDSYEKSLVNSDNDEDYPRTQVAGPIPKRRGVRTRGGRQDIQ